MFRIDHALSYLLRRQAEQQRGQNEKPAAAPRIYEAI